MSMNAVERCWDQNKECVALCWQQYNQCQNECSSHWPQWSSMPGNLLGNCLDKCDSILQTSLDSCKDEYAACEARATQPAGPKRFTQQQKDSLVKIAKTSNFVGAGFGVVGISIRVIPIPWVVAGGTFLAITGAVFGTCGAYANKLSNDPIDSDFTTVAQPIVPSLLSVMDVLGTTSSPLAESVTTLFDNQAQIVAYFKALCTSIDRAQGAAVAQNSTAEHQQLQVARGYAQKLADLWDQVPSLQQVVVNQLNNNKMTVSLGESEIQKGLGQIAHSGFPPELQDMLQRCGINGQERDVVLRRLTREVYNVKPPIQFPDILLSPEKTSMEQEMANVMRQFAVASP